MASKGPNLRGYLEKPISLHLNKGRTVTGNLRGYDQFMNVVLGEAKEVVSPTEQNDLGMVVSIGSSFDSLLCNTMEFELSCSPCTLCQF
jgi:small nuclear ribonucleoprotein G